MSTTEKWASVLGILALAGCATPGAENQANVYDASQVNQAQEVKTVNILAIFPAKVKVNNARNKQSAQIAGGVLGALAGGVLANNIGRHGWGNSFAGGAVGGATGVAAGSLVPGEVLVDGVSVTYEQDGRTLNSTEVGEACQFSPGKAVLFSTDGKETRIQPNAACPPAAKA
jgi:outer membrane lipoprotein SlyB